MWIFRRKIKLILYLSLFLIIITIGDSNLEGYQQNIDSLIDDLKSSDIYKAKKAIEELTSIGSDAYEKIITHINDIDRNVSSRCIEILGNIGDKRALDPLLIKLTELSEKSTPDIFTKRFLRIITIQSLGKLGDLKTVPKLISIKNNGTEYDKVHSLIALSKIGEKSAPFELIGLLSSNNKNIRYVAADYIGKLSIKDGIDELVNSLNDEEWFVRDTAVESLGKLDAKEAIPFIKTLLDDPNPFVRQTTSEVLNQLTSGNF